MLKTLNPECDTCTHITSIDNLILETKFWRVTLAVDQAYLGRSFLTLKNHKESLSELDSEEWEDFYILVMRVENGYEKAFRSGRPFNWACMMNNSYKDPDPKPHIHWHVRPRHGQPVSIGSIQYEDTEYAHHYDKTRKAYADRATLDMIIKLIKDNI